MAGAVRTEVADAVMAAFYGALAAGRPYDVAANLARNVAALAALDTPQPGAWVQPQLLMRSPHALLWQPDASAMPAPLRRWRDGGLFVQNLYAGAVINAETVSSTIDIRGAQIGPGRAGGDPAAADPAAADQQRQLVEGQKKLQEQVAQMLAGQQVQNEALDVIRRQQLNELDLNTVLAGLQEVFVEVQRHNDLLLAASEAMDLAQVEAGLAESGLGVKQRFKLTLPLLLWFLSYEAEFEWDGRVDLQAAWERVKGQAPSATSARSG